MLAKVFLLGEVSEVLETMDPATGIGKCVFMVVTENASRDGNDAKVYTHQFHRVYADGKVGEICSRHLRRGSPVWIEGKIENTVECQMSGDIRVNTMYKCIIMKILGRDILKAMQAAHENIDDDFNYNA